MDSIATHGYSHEELTGMEIAVIGLAGRFPGAKNIDEYWDNLQGGKESISFFSEEEVLKAGISEALVANPNYIKARGILGDVDRFDASFFGYSPKDAAMMDPQQRIFLENAWNALEDAGYRSSNYPGKIGVYASVGFNSYLVLNMEVAPNFIHAEHGPQAMLGNDKDFLASRVSYKLNLTGPSVVVQSACSSSLVAIHQACQSLLSGEADMQLAGGITVRVPEQSGNLYQEGMINSPDGHCRAFDKDAAGTVAGNGVGIVVLKRLEDALEDRDNIYAVIKASAINNDGDDKVGYAAPSPSGQATVIESAQAMAEVPVESIGYIEAHGSGTKMGDPIEIDALKAAFDKQTDAKNFCAIGSVKANIGHLDAAAGVAGFIKSVLAIHNKKIPPSVNFEQPNPLCEFENSPFYITTECQDWITGDQPRRAGISSFGMGGTNAHIIIEEAPEKSGSGPSRPWKLLSMSAKNAKALDRMKDQVRSDLQINKGNDLADIAYTMHMGRSRFDHSAFVLAQTTQEAYQTMSQGHHGNFINAISDGEKREVTFMFSGQGAQYTNMTRALYENEAEFKADLDLCASLLDGLLDKNLLDVIFSEDENLHESNDNLNQTTYTQPALFSVEYALARQLMRWGIQPEAMIGHSIGEYVAATLAGVFKLQDALYVVANRGKLIQSLPTGDMLFVPLAEEQVKHYLNESIALAVVNSPVATVLSGDKESIEALQVRLESEGVRSKVIRTSHAFHSHMMEPILEDFKALFAEVQLNSPEIPIISNVSGDWLTAEQACAPDYWADHLRHTVRFADGIDKLTKGPLRYFVEVGPGNSLAQFTKQSLGSRTGFIVDSCQPKASDDTDALFTMLRTLGKLWQQGIEVDWNAYYQGEQRNRLSLRGYPFQGESYWVDLESKSTQSAGQRSRDEVFWTTSWAQSPSAPGQQVQRQQAIVLGANRLDSVINQLSGECGYVVTSTEGEVFRKDGNNYTLRQGCVDDLKALFADPRLDPSQAIDIVYSLRENQNTDNLAEFLNLLNILGDFASQNTSEIRLSIIANDTFCVTGGEQPNWITQTACDYLQGLQYLIPTFCWQFIDTGILDQAAERLLQQDLQMFANKHVIAYRQGRRWQRSLKPFALHETEATCGADTYVLLGQPTTFSANLVRTLSGQSKDRYVFVMETLLPAEEWQAEVENGNETYRCLVELQQYGIDVTAVSSPADDDVALKSLITQYSRTGTVAVLGIANVDAALAENQLLGVDTKNLNAVISKQMKRQQLLKELCNTNVIEWSVWLSFQSSLLAYPDNALNIVEDHCARAVLAGQAEQRVVYLCDDFFGVEIEKDWLQRADFSERVTLLRRAIHVASQGEFVWLSASEPEAYPWQSSKASHLSSFDSTTGNEDKQDYYQRPELSVPYSAPITDRQKTICAIWQEMFQIEKIGIHDNFFDLGGDSVTALKLLSDLDLAFDVALPLSEVINSPTVAEQANSVVEFTDTPMDQRKLSPIVALQKQGDRPPFFCVHPAGGIIHCYIEMSRILGKDQPFYAFQHPGVDGKSGPYVTYPKMAELYIDAMLEIQPEGPYFIGGWSFGGTVAFEIAQQLIAQGKEVAMLAMFDSPGPSALYKLKDRPEFEFAGMLAFLSQAISKMLDANIEVSVDEMRNISPEDQLDYILERAAKVNGDEDLDSSKESLERIVDIFEVCDKGERYYEPTIYPDNIYMYRVQELADYEFTGYKDHPQLQSATFGWDELCSGEVIVRFVPGTHLSMIFPPNVNVLTDKFKVDLDERMRSVASN